MNLIEPSVTVVVPTYNEIDTLPSLLAALADLRRPGLRVLVVDDASPDGTGDLADDLAAGGWPLHVIHRTTKDGLGRAYVAGMRRALADDAEIIIQMDADLSHPVAAIPRLLAALDAGAGVAVGSRYAVGGSIDADWPWTRRALSRGANAYVNSVLHLGVHDATAGFKAWRADALAAIDLPSMVSRGYAFQIEATFRAHRAGVPITEVPIHFTDRSHGTSKMSLGVQLEAAIVPWRLRRQAAESEAEPRVLFSGAGSR